MSTFMLIKAYYYYYYYYAGLPLVPRYKLSGLERRAFRVAGLLVWNSTADCLRDPALQLASFKRQLKTFLFARH